MPPKERVSGSTVPFRLTPPEVSMLSIKLAPVDAIVAEPPATKTSDLVTVIVPPISLWLPQ